MHQAWPCVLCSSSFLTMNMDESRKLERGARMRSAKRADSNSTALTAPRSWTGRLLRRGRIETRSTTLHICPSTSGGEGVKAAG